MGQPAVAVPAGGPQLGSALSTAQVFRLLWALYFTHVLQAVLTTMPFVVAVYMVRDWQGELATEQAVGKATGLLAAVFCAAQLCTSFPWGLISDRIGRKPVLVIGNVSCVASTLLFGLAGHYWQAMAARAVGGALNAIILCEKSIIGEGLADKASQARAFGLMSLCWGLGSLAGPVIGGSLSKPCAGFLAGSAALCGPHSLLVARPYFLPCLLAAVLSAGATVATICCLDETLPSRRAAGGGGGGARYQQVAASDDSRLRPADSAGQLELQPSWRKGGGMPVDAGTSGGKLRAFRGDSARMHLGSSGAAQTQRLQQQPGGGGSGSDSDGDDMVLFGPGDLEAPAGPAMDACKQPPRPAPWYRQRMVLTTLAGYGLIAWLYNMLDEITPIFASAARADGGLGLSPSALAPSLSFGGAVLVVWALKGFPWAMRRVGVVHVLRLGLWCTGPMALMVPACTLLGGAAVPTQAGMLAAMAVKAIAATNVFTACLILVNAAAPPGSLGAVNGAGQSLASLARALGPALGGLSWAWSHEVAGSLPAWLPHQFLPFLAVAAMAWATLPVYWGVHVPDADGSSQQAKR